MHRADFCEQDAALIALLDSRADDDPRRRYAGWSAVAREVVRRGSALALWNESHPLTLEGDAALALARDRLTAWRAADVGFLTPSWIGGIRCR